MLFRSLRRRNPHMVNGLGAIMTGNLTLRRHRHKKPRIKPPRRPRRGYPVAQIRQPVQRQRQLMLLTQLRQRNLLPEQRKPLTMHRMTGIHQLPGTLLSQQNPRLLKTLPNRRQHIIRAALIQAHGLTDVSIFNPDRMRPRLRLLFVNRPAGEHKIPRHENGFPAALQEQGFNAVVSISGQNQGGRRANVHNLLLLLNFRRCAHGVWAGIGGRPSKTVRSHGWRSPSVTWMCRRSVFWKAYRQSPLTPQYQAQGYKARYPNNPQDEKGQR